MTLLRSLGITEMPSAYFPTPAQPQENAMKGRNHSNAFLSMCLLATATFQSGCAMTALDRSANLAPRVAPGVPQAVPVLDTLTDSPRPGRYAYDEI